MAYRLFHLFHAFDQPISQLSTILELSYSSQFVFQIWRISMLVEDGEMLNRNEVARITSNWTTTKISLDLFRFIYSVFLDDLMWCLEVDKWNHDWNNILLSVYSMFFAWKVWGILWVIIEMYSIM